MVAPVHGKLPAAPIAEPQSIDASPSPKTSTTARVCDSAARESTPHAADIARAAAITLPSKTRISLSELANDLAGIVVVASDRFTPNVRPMLERANNSQMMARALAVLRMMPDNRVAAQKALDTVLTQHVDHALRRFETSANADALLRDATRHLRHVLKHGASAMPPIPAPLAEIAADVLAFVELRDTAVPVMRVGMETMSRDERLQHIASEIQYFRAGAAIDAGLRAALSMDPQPTPPSLLAKYALFDFGAEGFSAEDLLSVRTMMSDADRGLAAMFWSGVMLGVATQLATHAGVFESTPSRIGVAVDTLELTATQRSVRTKLSGYLLNPHHPVGAIKAKWFEGALGFDRVNAEYLARQIIFYEPACSTKAVTQFGTQLEQRISIAGANGRVLDVTFGWIRNTDGVVRLVTGIPIK